MRERLAAAGLPDNLHAGRDAVVPEYLHVVPAGLPEHGCSVGGGPGRTFQGATSKGPQVLPTAAPFVQMRVIWATLLRVPCVVPPPPPHTSCVRVVVSFRAAHRRDAASPAQADRQGAREDPRVQGGRPRQGGRSRRPCLRPHSPPSPSTASLHLHPYPTLRYERRKSGEPLLSRAETMRR